MGMDNGSQDSGRLDASLAQHGARVVVPDAASFLKAKIHIAINRLMATYLGNLEELADEHDEAMRKLMDALPAELREKVVLAAIFGTKRFDAIRKHVLTAGNGQIRELNETVEFLRLQQGYNK